MISNKKSPVDNTLELFRNLSDEEKREFSSKCINDEKREKETKQEWEDPWKRYTLVDAYKPLPDVQYLAGNLLALPSLSIVYGAPGTLKSMLVQDLVTSIVKGDDWLPSMPGKNDVKGIKTLKSPVMWVDNDNGSRITNERIAAFARARELPQDAPLYYYSMPSPRLEGNSSTHIEDLIRRVIEVKAKVVVIDNLGTISSGCDENSSQMITVMANLRKLAEETGSAVILIHHQRKNNGFSGRTGESLRGHSSIEAAVDTSFLITRKDGTNEISVKATKVRGSEISPFQALFTYQCKEGTKDLSTAKFFGISTGNSIDSQIGSKILDSLSKGVKNKTTLAKDVQASLPNIGINTIRDEIDIMAEMEEEIILVKGGKANEKLYDLKTKSSNKKNSSAE